MSFTPTNDESYASLGDAGHVATMTSALIFAYSVVHFAGSTSDNDGPKSDPLFDPLWKQDGFCLAHRDQPYWTSHDVCLYVDIVAAILLYTLHHCVGRNNADMRRVQELLLPNIVGMVAHGIGHFSAARLRTGDQETTTALRDPANGKYETTLQFLVTAILPILLFWIGLLKAALPNFKIHTLSALAAIALYGQTLLGDQRQYQFTFVQTILLVASSMKQLARPKEEKDFVYGLFPVLVAFPVTFVGWIESTQCTAFVRDEFYGHVVYDAFIPVALLVWYVVCYLQINEAKSFQQDSSSNTPETGMKKEKLS